MIATGGKESRRPEGEVFGSWSLGPLTSMKKIASGFVPYLRAERVRAGVSVFRIHIGQPFVVASDAVSADFFFRADPTLLDRGSPGTFGPVGLRPQVVKVEPLLT